MEIDQGSHRENVPVFSSEILSFVGAPDPVFAEYGYIRPSAVRSGKSNDPDARQPANLAFQLRHLFGPGSRSEVMRVLLTFTDGPLDVARISDEAGDLFAETTDSEYLISSRARDLMERVAPSLEMAGLALPADRRTPGAAYLPFFTDTIDSLLSALNA